MSFLRRDRKKPKMKNRLSILLLTLTIIISILPLSLALETYPVDKLVELKFLCRYDEGIPAGASYNVTISYPNGSSMISNLNTTSLGLGSFKYQLTFPIQGIYKIQSFCYNGTASSSNNEEIEVTYDGNYLDISRTIMYLGLTSVLGLLFVLILIIIPKLPSSDIMNDEGLIININQLKYLRPVMYALSWGLLLGIIFMISNISIAYLPTNMFGTFFFSIYRVMFILTLPMLIIWFIFMFVKIWRDREIKHMLERGVDIRGSP